MYEAITAFCTTTRYGLDFLSTIRILRNTARYGTSLNLPCFSPSADVLAVFLHMELAKGPLGGVSLAEAQIPTRFLASQKAFFIP